MEQATGHLSFIFPLSSPISLYLQINLPLSPNKSPLYLLLSSLYLLIIYTLFPYYIPYPPDTLPFIFRGASHISPFISILSPYYIPSPCKRGTCRTKFWIDPKKFLERSGKNFGSIQNLFSIDPKFHISPLSVSGDAPQHVFKAFSGGGALSIRTVRTPLRPTSSARLSAL